MPLAKEKTTQIFTAFGGNAANTGSIEGQIAQLTERISQISGHLQQNKKRLLYTPWFDATGR